MKDNNETTHSASDGSSRRARGRRDSWAAEIITGVSSVLLGSLTAWQTILSESYSNFTAMDLVDDIKKKFRDDFGPQHVEKLKARGYTSEESFNIIVKNNKDYNKAIAERFQEAGFGKFSKRMELLSSHEKWKIALTSLAVTGVTLGSLLLLTKDLFSEKKEASEPDAEKLLAPRHESFVQAEQDRQASAPSASLSA